MSGIGTDTSDAMIGVDNKKAKLLAAADDNSQVVVNADGQHESSAPVSVHERVDIRLGEFEFVRVLNENSRTKWIAIEGRHEQQPAVIVMEKMAFSEDNVKQILEDKPSADYSPDSWLRRDFHNDIYGNYFAYPDRSLNSIKTTIIHPASDQHIHKYLRQEMRVVRETAELYRTVTEPYIQSRQLSLQWVQNILDGKSESERVVSENADPESGFVLLPDMKWDGIQLESLYLVAICRKSGIRSLRDLNETHLPLLLNVKRKCCDAIERKYGVTGDQLRVYIHYQPSYYHFHIHFTLVSADDSASVSLERCHLLDTVINNIQLCADYYQRSTLIFAVKQNDPLFQKFVE
ncbi:m7GpppX diphosphatase-like, partial [Oppia nitens]|uniref:m7GpppX diphosphatase-like n=1 Tax=Oppia nitens TaxID=1686743 RepID=UPI0023DAD033